ncbi:MAG: PEP-CTERM sorting domain-containing protein [Desulfobacterales bacterium]|nr:PEP-CTERM sorting domain-containing protein [Desulfobacterales bacterium]
MKHNILTIICITALAMGIFSTTPVWAARLPYSITSINDFLNDDTYFNDYEHLDNIDFSGSWDYTVIGYESRHWNWIREGGNTTFATWNRGAFGTFNTVDFDTSDLYFQDYDGPFNIGLNPYVHNNFFEIFRLTEASESLSYLATPVTLPVGTVIVGFNDNGFDPRVGDADFDDIIVALTPGEDGTLTPIPEPGTLLLLGCGLMGLAGVGRKRFQTP